MELSEDLRKRLMEISGISNMKDLEGLLKDVAPQAKEEDGQVKTIKKFIQNPGVFDVAIFQKVWNFFLTEYSSVKSYLEEEKPSDRSISKSEDFRKQGNEAYEKKKLKTAIRLYSEAIQAIPPEENASEALALALANRSAAFFEADSLKESLRDARAALYFKFPSSKRFKLHERIAKIFTRQGLTSLAKEEYEKVSQSEHAGGKIPEDMKKATKSLDQPQDVLMDCTVDLGNEIFPQLRKGIKVVYDAAKGRHCVSEEEIAPGELILSEEPIVCYLNPEFHNKNCPSCLKTLGSFILPSLSCGSKFYCSLQCLKEDSKLHDFWKARRILGEDSTFNIYLTLKVLQGHDPNSLAKLLEKQNYHWGADKIDAFDKYNVENQFKTLFNLMDHPRERELEEEAGIYARAVLSIRLLRDSGYLKSKSSSESLSNKELILANAIYRLNSGFKYNIHSINKVSEKEGVGSNKCVPLTDIGSGVYPTLLFLNHSCNPNTYRFNQGKRVLLYSKRKIFPGEEITECYGIHHFSLPFEERQKSLYKGYRFKCSCRACALKFPLFIELKKQNLKGIDEHDLNEKIKEIKALSEEKNYQKAAEDSRKLLQTLYNSTKNQTLKPNKIVEHVSLVFCYSQWQHLTQMPLD